MGLSDKIKFKLFSGKNSKLAYYIRQYWLNFTPPPILRVLRGWNVDKLDEVAKQRSDYEYVMGRVDYYNRLQSNCVAGSDLWQKESIPLGEQRMVRQKVYFLDSMEYARFFSKGYRWILLPGDITYVPQSPSIVKSRPIAEASQNANSVIMKLDKVRHFIFVDDKISFKEKQDRAIFRGKVAGKANRLDFMEKMQGNPRFDIGAIDKVKEEWTCEKMTIGDHLKFRYIMCLEGNDVASNVKWVMSSNSIAIMPKPQYETWFMEGTLIPGYHYIEVKPDYSDVESQLNYYSSHIDEAEAIIQHAHEYVNQFKDNEREDLISLLVMDKYFRQTGNA